jgi:hypothetical protein
MWKRGEAGIFTDEITGEEILLLRFRLRPPHELMITFAEF